MLTIDGHFVEREPHEYPYSYTRFCLWKRGWNKEDHVLWSDRLYNQYKNYSDIKNEILGMSDNFAQYTPEQIETFLCRLFEKDVTVTGMEQECNYATGYPYWLIYFRYKEENKNDKQQKSLCTEKGIQQKDRPLNDQSSHEAPGHPEAKQGDEENLLSRGKDTSDEERRLDVRTRIQDKGIWIQRRRR